MITFSIDYGYMPKTDATDLVLRLKRGELGIFPTDSVYTLACALSSRNAIHRLCKLVEKKPDQAQLSIICSNFNMISKFTTPFSTACYRAMNAALPGPYTFILNADVHQTKHWENKRKTIGVRIPNEPFLPDIINEIGEPLICSSLHSEDELRQYFTDPADIDLKFNNEVDFFVTEGYGGNTHSTVIDCTTNTPQLVREGAGKWPL